MGRYIGWFLMLLPGAFLIALGETRKWESHLFEVLVGMAAAVGLVATFAVGYRLANGKWS